MEKKSTLIALQCFLLAAIITPTAATAQSVNGYDETRIAADVTRADSLYKAEDYSAARDVLAPITILDFDKRKYPPSWPKAIHLMGKVFQFGFEKCDLGRYYYELCVNELHYAPAYYDLGHYWWGNDCSIYHDCGQAFDIWMEGAKKGDAGCQYEVARVYSFGLVQAGIKGKDYDKGEKYLRMALKQGYPDAYWLMGVYMKSDLIAIEYYSEWLAYWIEGAKRGSYKCAEAIHYDSKGEHQFCKQFGLHD